MAHPLSNDVLDQLFTQARTANTWLDTPVGEDQIRALYALLKMAPTSANCSPTRYIFVTSDAAKEKLKPHVMDGNVTKVMAAPVTVIMGYDMAFADHMPTLFPHDPTAKHWFDDPAVKFATAFRNSSLQGAYLIMAARALGLDCGPMSGFDQDGVDKAFFDGTEIKSNFLCALGHADPSGLFDRSPRFDFEDVAKIV